MAALRLEPEQAAAAAVRAAHSGLAAVVAMVASRLLSARPARRDAVVAAAGVHGIAQAALGRAAI